MTVKEQVKTFLDKLSELYKCKFIMATGKIKDLLKCIVNCPDVYNLFDAVTREFDYPTARMHCLITVNDGTYNRSYVVLPQTIGQRLAFIFCLFVEFDKESINFNEFLRRYFPEDGSYFASYHAFCATVVKGLEDAVVQVFKNELDAPDEPAPVAATPDPASSNGFETIRAGVYAEMQFIGDCTDIPDEEKEGALVMLNELLEAVTAGKRDLINALIYGYNYFLLYHGRAHEEMNDLIAAINAYGN